MLLVHCRSYKMLSSMCFMSVVMLLVMDMRTGALQESHIQPSQCYSCRYNDTTSCDQSSGWSAITCPTERPLCATTASAPDFRSSLVCAPAFNNSCTVKTTLNSSFVITCICRRHLCNAPFTSQWRNKILEFISNHSKTNQQSIYEIFLEFTNITEKDTLYKAITIETIDSVIQMPKTSPNLVPVTATINTRSTLKDSEKPRAESLKNEPTVPSDDDEDGSEGSGLYEESSIHKNTVSAPAAPSSFLPANENSASVLYKDLFIFLIFIVTLIDLI